jgi:hypothetical protein
MRIFIDRTHRLPRVWSNRELARFAHLFHGDLVNVSGWTDVDKEGRHYKDYFVNASSYTITNYKKEARGFQGYSNEVFLDLEQELPSTLYQRYDAAFSHTTMEHIYAVDTAFANLCGLSKDIVILVVPFLQQYHAEYGDYWRFTPLAIKRMFEDNGFELVYQSFNTHKRSSVYTFSIASRRPEAWAKCIEWSFSCIDPKAGGPEPYIGCRAIPNWAHRLRRLVKDAFGRDRSNVGLAGQTRTKKAPKTPT